MLRKRVLNMVGDRNKLTSRTNLISICPQPKKKMEKKEKALFFLSGILICLLAELIFVLIFPIYVTGYLVSENNINSPTYLPKEYEFVSNMTETELFDYCNYINNEEVTESEYVDCIGYMFHRLTEYERCGNRSGTKQAMDVINTGTGCCRDAASYYAYFLDKRDIEYVKFYVPKNENRHVFVIATLRDEFGDFDGYAVLDFNKHIVYD